MKKSKGWLYLPIEVKVRETDAKLLLAYYAAKEGYRVVTGDHVMVEMASEVYPKGIFFSKGYSHGVRKRVITNAEHYGHTIVELDEEGLLIKPKQYIRDRMRRDMLQLVKQEYCWGNYQKKVIHDVNPDFEQKCFVTGNLRFDLLKPKFSRIYQKEAEGIIHKYGKFVLINTRFTRYNTPKGKQENVYFQDIKALYYHFLALVKEMSVKYPRMNFIIRPHPGEDFNSYQKEFAHYKNVYIIHEGNIIKWLMAAEVVIHNGCTSGIETFLLGKPLISYVPISSKKKGMNLPNQLGMKAASNAEVAAGLSAVLKNDNKESFNHYEKDLYDFCEWSADTYSYETILRLCSTISLPESPGVFSLPQKTFSIKNKKQRKRRFSLTEEEIYNFFGKLDEIEDEVSPIYIKKLGKNLFKIEREMD
ncbi:surface carbohydrate biosynthesis protein [Virgibacillus ihumii]|uniref:surface carbohydrate biosynthesis protein n=1 Tax=Virgibacillus ihumii TaxID=2686091 RepID=UPI00157D281A|nr:surface carbohydrate biosynthesis protein [Virgibacillus ihumii]